MDANLIDQTCKKTPDYNLCVSSLNLDLRSAAADIAGLGLVMVDIAKTKADDVAKKINKLLQQSPSDPPLNSCAHFYKTILEADIPEAAKAFIGNPKFAEQGINDVAGEAQTCEEGFSGKSPLTNENKVVHDVYEIAVAIVEKVKDHHQDTCPYYESINDIND